MGHGPDSYRSGRSPRRAGTPSRTRALRAIALVAALAAASAHADVPPANDAPDLVDGRASWRRAGSVVAPPGAPSAATAAEAEPPPSRTPARRAPALGPIAAQRLLAGRPWRLQLRGRGSDGERPRVEARGLPDGARLVPLGEDGWYALDWTPPRDAQGSVEITLVAVDRRDPTLRGERRLRLDIESASELPAAPPPLERSTAESVPTAAEDALVATILRAVLAPTIAPIPTQIVSAGRVVRFRVDARLVGGDSARLSIDRLPRHASFDANADGSRTFYWPTGDGDQGEHRFRITALHPDDDTLGTSVEALVIVGDPTRGSTRPAGVATPVATAPAPLPQRAAEAEREATALPETLGLAERLPLDEALYPEEELYADEALYLDEESYFDEVLYPEEEPYPDDDSRAFDGLRADGTDSYSSEGIGDGLPPGFPDDSVDPGADDFEMIVPGEKLRLVPIE